MRCIEYYQVDKYMVIRLSGVLLMHIKKECPELSVGCESYLALGNWLTSFDLVSWQWRKISPFRDRIAQALGLYRLYGTFQSWN